MTSSDHHCSRCDELSARLRAAEQTIAALVDQRAHSRAREEERDLSLLTASEARFRAIVEKSLRAVTLSAADGRRFYATAAVDALLGYDAATLPAAQDFDRVHPDDLPQVMQLGERLLEEPDHCFAIEFRCLHRDGSYHWVEAVLTNLLDEPAVRGVVASLRDVTDRKNAEQELEDSRYLLEKGQAVAHVGSYSSGLGLDDRILPSRECARIFGWTEGAAVTVGQFYGQVHPEDLDDVQRAVLRAASGELPYEAEFRAFRTDGSLRWLQASAVVERSARGPRLIGVVQDVTERHDAERMRNQLAAIVASSSDAIVSADLQGTIVSWNRGAERLYGYSAQEAIGSSMFMLVPAEAQDEEAGILEGLSRGEGVQALETQRRRKDGTLVPVSLTVSPVRDSDGRIIGGSKIARDLTSQRQAELALRRSEEQLRHSQKMEAIGSLAGGVAHDFNNLLSIIVGYSSILLAAIPQDGAHRAELEEIARAGQKSVALTRQLLAFSRRQVLQPVSLDLNAVVLGFERMVRRLLGEDIELVLSTQSSLAMVRADPTQIEQVLMNLVVNARDAMPDGGRIEIRTRNAHVSAGEAAERMEASPGEYVVLSVTDSGTGIDEAIRERIFEPFFTTKGKDKGTGLGLSTAFGIVRQSGGHITVESTPGAGATFSVYLPHCASCEERPSSSSSDVTGLSGTETVLVVEDDDAVRALTRTVLKQSGYHVLEAQNAGEALMVSEAFAGTIHLLLTDLVMPRISGRVLSERLSRARPNMRTLFMSGYTEELGKLQGALDAGGAFFAKPVQPDALRRKVREVIGAAGV